MRLLFILLFGLLLSCGSGSEERKIKVACAANMQYAMDSIAVLFEAESGIQCDITSGSSGMLTSQIENGAPYDIFVSANMNYPETIFKNGNGDKPIIYARGRLVLVLSKQKAYGSIDEVLADPNMERIGVADNATAPYGMATYQYLEKTNRIKTLESQLVIGESIGQVNQYITTNAVDAAFTSYSFKVKHENDYQYFEVDQQMFDPINQGAMMLNHGKNSDEEACNTMLDFLASEKCKAVLNYFGYLTD